MNTRDPFDLHRSSPKFPFAAIQSGIARSSSAQKLNTAKATGDEEIMSYPVSRHGHSSNNDQKQQDDSWQPRKQPQATHMGAFEEKLNDLFASATKDGLPMYKDKPFSYAASRRKLPFWNRRRLGVGLVGVIVLLFYWMGLVPSLSGSVKNNEPSRTRLGRESKAQSKTWHARREQVRDAFKLSWKAYETHGWGFDEYHPITKSGKQMVPNGMGWIIVDALDTMMLMNLTAEVTHAREWISEKLSYDQDHDVNTFETTIRMLGGLLSAHYLSTEFPYMAPIADLDATGGEDLYLEKASELAGRLLGAFESDSGIPYASVNLAKRKGIQAHDNGGASSTAEAATLQLEFKYLANLTGEDTYWDTVEDVIKVIDDNGVRDGLVPIYIHADQGTFQGKNIRLGSRGDSYYEYLIKQYLQTSKAEPIYLELWEQALAGVQKHLITYSEKANLTILAERPDGLDGAISPKMDHLVCFMPGTIALAATGGKPLSEAKQSSTWGAKQDAEIELATELMKTCWGMYAVTATGLSPEIAHFHISDPPAMMSSEIRHSPKELSSDPGALWRQDYDIHANDFHNLQRPETVESLFYMWRITGDIKYREWGWTMFEAFMKHTRVPDDGGFTSLNNVDAVPAPPRDNMESFWLAETLKYFYLLFGPDDVLPLDEIVLNTEAHPFPRFEMGKLFETGWTRRPRDKDGNIVPASGSPPPPSTPGSAAVLEEKPKGGDDTKAKEPRDTEIVKVEKVAEQHVAGQP